MNRTLVEFFNHFADIYQESRHDTLWATAGVHRDGNHRGHLFVFASMNPETASRAAALLGAAGLLCETTIETSGENDSTTCIPSAVVDGLRALCGAPEEP